MPTCKEVAAAVASDQLAEAGWWRRLRLRLHLILCPPCERYAAEIRALGDAARDLYGTVEGDQERLRRLEASILDCLPEAEGDPEGK